jgi:hypothetical protein
MCLITSNATKGNSVAEISEIRIGFSGKLVECKFTAGGKAGQNGKDWDTRDQTRLNFLCLGDECTIIVDGDVSKLYQEGETYKVTGVLATKKDGGWYVKRPQVVSATPGQLPAADEPPPTVGKPGMFGARKTG